MPLSSAERGARFRAKHGVRIRSADEIVRDRAASKAWRAANPGRAKALTQAWLAANPARNKARKKAYAKENAAKLLADNRRFRGLPEPAYPMPDICELPGCTRKAACLDHDHETGAFRGWLCHHCNWAIGRLGDTLERVEAAATYLRRSLCH